MKVLNLRCANGHGFEGWFGSEDDFLAQNGRGDIACPLCADHVISRMPSAPRLNLHSAKNAARTAGQTAAEDAAAEAGGTNNATNNASNKPSGADIPAVPPQAADLQAAWMQAVRHLVANTEDVGPRFAEEARRIHYGEGQQRGIRGQASAQERLALREEGIETVAVPIPEALKSPLQ